MRARFHGMGRHSTYPHSKEIVMKWHLEHLTEGYQGTRDGMMNFELEKKIKSQNTINLFLESHRVWQHTHVTFKRRNRKF